MERKRSLNDNKFKMSWLKLQHVLNQGKGVIFNLFVIFRSTQAGQSSTIALNFFFEV